MNIMGDTVNIREARSEDCEDIMLLNQELAEFGKAPRGPRIDVDTFRRDGFGEERMFRCFVAEDVKEQKLIGYALYFFSYSAWDGVNVYMEDLYVTPSHRHRGIGGKLWREVARVAVKRKCKKLHWECLDWNTNSIEMYESKGARNVTIDEGWNNFSMKGDRLKDFANGDNGNIKDMHDKSCQKDV